MSTLKKEKGGGGMVETPRERERELTWNRVKVVIAQVPRHSVLDIALVLSPLVCRISGSARLVGWAENMTPPSERGNEETDQGIRDEVARRTRCLVADERDTRSKG